MPLAHHRALSTLPDPSTRGISCRYTRKISSPTSTTHNFPRKYRNPPSTPTLLTNPPKTRSHAFMPYQSTAPQQPRHAPMHPPGAAPRQQGKRSSRRTTAPAPGPRLPSRIVFVIFSGPRTPTPTRRLPSRRHRRRPRGCRNALTRATTAGPSSGGCPWRTARPRTPGAGAGTDDRRRGSGRWTAREEAAAAYSPGEWEVYCSLGEFMAS